MNNGISNTKFLHKWKNRIETIGKGGIIDIIQDPKAKPISKITKFPIQMQMNRFLNKSKSAEVIFKKHHKPDIEAFLDKSINVYARPANNLQNIIDHGYTPYTIKDYKKLPKEVKLGKLGPDIYTKEWYLKKERVEKMKQYGSHIFDVGKGLVFKHINPLPSEINRKQRMEEIKRSKRNKMSDYGRKLVVKECKGMLRYEQEREAEIERLRNLDNDNVHKQNMYYERLRKIKTGLIDN